jgi:branched-chain amino acid transport system ATP-binding protein
MSALLEVEGLQVSYGKISALRDIGFRMEPSRTVTVIGPNGAGKTTLLKALMGMVRYEGHVRMLGHRLDGLSVEERAERGLVLVPETRELFTHMSIGDNLLLGAYLHRRDKVGIARHLDEVFSLFPRLRERRSQVAGTLSGGERQMLALGRALMGRPKLLMLDEPSLGLAPLVVMEIFRIIDHLRERGTSILLVEQNARAALKAADYAYVLETGDMVQHGPAADMLDDPMLASVYLGGAVHPVEQGSST